MKQAISQESVSDSGHSCSPENQSSPNRVKSAAMLGIALSVGASGALVSQTEASATVSAPAVSDTTKAFSSDSKASQSQAAEAKVDQVEIVAYHTVESGESLWQIAQQHRIGLRELKVANGLPPETSIRVGQVLKVPGNSEVLPGALSLEITESSSPSEMVALESASELSDSAPDLMNQSIEQTATADEVGTAEISVLTTAEVDSLEVLNQS
ncbi:MAG: LysM peptidoglycan-binding domain-containing protein, partial [Cyanobacteria bacterium P01_F01_bin.3]